MIRRDDNMDQNEVIETLSDKQVLEHVEGLSLTVLQKYRAKLKKIGVLKTRERLFVHRDIAILKKIVNMKQDNPALFYSTIIEIVVKSNFQEKALVDTIFENSEDSRVHDRFLEICEEKGIKEDLIDNFFNSANVVGDFLKLLGHEDFTRNYNASIDILIAAVVGRSYR